MTSHLPISLGLPCCHTTRLGLLTCFSRSMAIHFSAKTMSYASINCKPHPHLEHMGSVVGICTILHIWGIAFLANPLRHPCFPRLETRTVFTFVDLQLQYYQIIHTSCCVKKFNLVRKYKLTTSSGPKTKFLYTLVMGGFCFPMVEHCS